MFSLPVAAPLCALFTCGAISVLPPLSDSPPLWKLAGILVVFALATIASERRTAERETAVAPTRDPARASSAGRRRALIVGAGAVGRQLADSLESGGRYHVIGFVDDDADELEPPDRPLLGARIETPRIVREYSVDEVFLAYAPTWQEQLAEALAEDHPAVRVNVVPTPYEALLRTSRVENVGDIALVRLNPERTGFSRDLAKRMLDILLATTGLILLAPVSLIVALAIKATSRGPVIFAQERVGRFGRRFILYKFRTMVQDAEAQTGPVLSNGDSDERLTAIGRWLKRFRIDEVPQLWNVLCGDMSMVGPRPERPCFVEKFEVMSPSYSRRHVVRPGITGLAQVCGGYHTHWRDKLRFDLYYTVHYSVWMDISILLRTILVVILPGSNKRRPA